MSFKKGDVVECVHQTNSTLIQGMYYTVEGVDYGWLDLKGIAGFQNPDRFKLVEPPQATSKNPFPHDSKARKEIPIVTGLLCYFPSALMAVARVSKKGNDKHNPGQPMHHDRSKSTDQIDCAGRHILEFECDNDALDPDTQESVLAHAIWRLCARLQIHLESKGAPLAPRAKLSKADPG